MKHGAKLALWGTAAVTVIALVGLAAPAFVPLLPHRVQEALAGPIEPIHPIPGTVEELLAVDDGGRFVSHAGVDAEYVAAAKIWPWAVPAGFAFPGRRGVADTPGPHHRGMGLQAAFSNYAYAVLEAVDAGDYDPDPSRPLDELQDAYETLFEAGVLSDPDFVAKSITPRR